MPQDLILNILGTANILCCAVNGNLVLQNWKFRNAQARSALSNPTHINTSRQFYHHLAGQVLMHRPDRNEYSARFSTYKPKCVPALKKAKSQAIALATEGFDAVSPTSNQVKHYVSLLFLHL